MTQDSDKLYDLIEAWLDGKLPPEEAASLSERLERDDDFRFRVEQHRLAREVIGQWITEDYKTKIQSWKKELDEPPPVNKPPLLNWWIIGLGLLLLVVGGIWHFTPAPDLKNHEPEEQKTTVPIDERPIADDETEPIKEPEPIEEPRVQNPPTKKKPSTKPEEQEAVAQKPEKKELELSLIEDLIAEADIEINGFKAYLDQTIKTRGENEPNFKAGTEALSSGEYVTARQYFEQVPASSPNYNAALQLLAFTFYKEKNYSKAVDIYEQYAPRKFGQTTNWWLSQFYLADYNRSKTKFWKTLNEIIHSPRNTVYKEKAIKLKQELGEKGLEEL